VYGERVADEHLWDDDDGTTGPWANATGPLCQRCGLPRGTYQWERADDAHRADLGHGIGTGACVDACGPDFDPFATERREAQTRRAEQ
jgi:hypothetical protein